MKITLLLATYNWKEALELLFISVFRQSVLPSEIVIADDGSREDTRELIDLLAKTTSTPIHHIWHPDEGHRKGIIMNKAIEKAQGEYIIQVDGDVVLHRNFIRDHLIFAQKGCFIRGYRIMLDEEQTMDSLREKRIDFPSPLDFRRLLRLSFNSILLTRFTLGENCDMENVYTLIGCNMSYWKEDVIRINGYDENICGWGGEDTEFAVRLYNIGLRQRKLKYAAIMHHLHHDELSRDRSSSNKKVYEITIEKGIKFCDNGICKQKELLIEKQPMLPRVSKQLNP